MPSHTDNAAAVWAKFTSPQALEKIRLLKKVERTPGIRFVPLTGGALVVERVVEGLMKDHYLTTAREDVAPLAGPKMYLTEKGLEHLRLYRLFLADLGGRAGRASGSTKLSNTAAELLEKIRSHGVPRGTWSATITQMGRGTNMHWAGGREYKALEELIEKGYAVKMGKSAETDRGARGRNRKFITLSAKLTDASLAGRAGGRASTPKKAPAGPASGFGKEKTAADIRARIAWETWAANEQRRIGHEALAVGHDLTRQAYVEALSRHGAKRASKRGHAGGSHADWWRGVSHLGAPMTRIKKAYQWLVVDPYGNVWAGNEFQSDAKNALKEMAALLPAGTKVMARRTYERMFK
jgi:hypothetical protein